MASTIIILNTPCPLPPLLCFFFIVIFVYIGFLCVSALKLRAVIEEHLEKGGGLFGWLGLFSGDWLVLCGYSGLWLIC